MVTSDHHMVIGMELKSVKEPSGMKHMLPVPVHMDPSVCVCMCVYDVCGSVYVCMCYVRMYLF